jgi:hypothetical protein
MEASLAVVNTVQAAPLKGMGPFGLGNCGADGRRRRTSVRRWDELAAAAGATRSRDGWWP